MGSSSSSSDDEYSYLSEEDTVSVYDDAEIFMIRSMVNVRSEMDRKSMVITSLCEGTMVRVQKQCGNRLKIVSPIHGWIPMYSEVTSDILVTKVTDDDEDYFFHGDCLEIAEQFDAN